MFKRWLCTQCPIVRPAAYLSSSPSWHFIFSTSDVIVKDAIFRNLFHRIQRERKKIFFLFFLTDPPEAPLRRDHDRVQQTRLHWSPRCLQRSEHRGLDQEHWRQGCLLDDRRSVVPRPDLVRTMAEMERRPAGVQLVSQCSLMLNSTGLAMTTLTTTSRGSGPRWSLWALIFRPRLAVLVASVVHLVHSTERTMAGVFETVLDVDGEKSKPYSFFLSSLVDAEVDLELLLLLEPPDLLSLLMVLRFFRFVSRK